MAANSINSPFPIITDIDGQPLEGGYVWIGVAGLDPQTNPQNAYWDSALTALATQPARTIGGYPIRSGAPGRLYTNGDYSIRVMNKNGTTIYSSLYNLNRITGDQVGFTGPDGLPYSIADIADSTSNLKGDALIAVKQPFAGSVPRTQHEKNAELISVLDFGAVADGITDDTPAVNLAIAYLVSVGGGNLYFPAGTYFCKVNLSKLGSGKWVRLFGDGWATIIQYNSGVIVDISGSSYVSITDLRVHALSGCAVNILSTRYAGFPFNAGGTEVRRVYTTGGPSVCGFYHIGAEVSSYVQCNFQTTGAAPVFLISSNNDLNYNSPNGTILEPVSQLTTKFSDCTFIKDGGVEDIGPLLQIGGGVYLLEFHHCYFNGMPGRGCIELNGAGKSDKSQRHLIIKSCNFEANTCSATEGAHGIYRVPAGGVGTLSGLVVEDCFFRQIRNAPGYYDIGNVYLESSRIKNCKTSYGGGLNIVAASNCEIEWDGAEANTAGAITGGDASFTIAHGSHFIQTGDVIAVGYSARVMGGAGATATEIVTVGVITPGTPNDTIAVAPAFALAHPAADRVIYALPLVTTAQQCEFRVKAWPFLISSDLGNKVVTRGTDFDYREYYGPPRTGAITNSQAPVRIDRSFVREPNNPQNGMRCTVREGTDWAGAPQLASVVATNFPVVYSSGWKLFPMGLPGAATYDPPPIAGGATTSTTVTVTGAALGDYAVASFSRDTTGIVLLAVVTSTNTVTVVFWNTTGAGIDLASGTLRAMIFKS